MLILVLTDLLKRFQNSESIEDKEIEKFLLFVIEEYKNGSFKDEGEFLVACVVKYKVKGKNIGCPLIKKLFEVYSKKIAKQMDWLIDTKKSYDLNYKNMNDLSLDEIEKLFL